MASKAGQNAPTIVIKKVKKGGGGHHGGAWKVAYADFVTAMMAFFMLLWLLTTSEKVSLQGLADYFTPSNSTMSNSSGAGAILAGTALENEGAKSSGSISSASPSASPQRETEAESQAAERSQNASGAEWQIKTPTRPDQQMLQAEEALKTAIQETPELQKHSDQIILEQTPDGLRIQLIDKDGRPMFRTGTAELYPFAANLLGHIGRVVEKMPNRLAVYGHTDGAGANVEGEYTNWELSSDRANAARRVLRRTGVSTDRFAEVVGRASTDLLYPEAPFRPENKRIAVLLMREAPVVDPAFGAR